MAVSQCNECALSYEQTKTSIFDVTNLSRGTESRMIFRNGKHFPTEAINIYYKGQYWRSPLEITDGFYSKKVARANLSADSFCLNYDLNWLRKDAYTLVPFNEKTCKSTSTLDFSVTTNSVAVLRVKIKKDAE